MIELDYIHKKYGAEMALLVLLGRLYFKTATAGEVQQFIDGNKIDWPLFELVIKTHQLRPFVNNLFFTHSINIDEAFYKKLKHTASGLAKRNFTKVNELLRLYNLFSAAGLESISYKGMVLSKVLFNDFVSRETSDIDFMVMPADFGRVRQLLLDEGYTSSYYNPNHEKLFLKSDNELLFLKKTSSGIQKVEIHWAITHKMMNIPFPVERIFEAAERDNILGTDITILDNQNRLLVLLVHHGVNDVWRILKHIVDLSVFIQKFSSETDWNEVEVLTRKHKIFKTACLGLSICNALYGIDVPERFKVAEEKVKPVLHNMLRYPPIKRKKLSAENVYQQFALRDSFGGKIKLMGAYIVTAIQPNMRDVEVLPLPTGLGVLYTLVKPFRLLADMFRKTK